MQAGELERGTARVGLVFAGTALRTSHDVPPDQYEPGVPADQQARSHSTLAAFADASLELGVVVKRNWAAELSLPLRYVLQTTTFGDGKGGAIANFQSIHHDDGSTVGLGDAGVGVRLRALDPGDAGGLQLDARPGLTLPTGGIEPDAEALGAAGQAHNHIFFGSGTFDPTLQLDAAWAFDGWRVVGFASARTSLYANRYGYRQGSRLAGGVGVQFRLLDDAWHMVVRPEFYAETESGWGDHHAEGSGRTDLIATGGVGWHPAPRWALNLLVKVPLMTRTDHDALDVPVLGALAVQYEFPLLPSTKSGEKP